jgi:hypothetical protein
MNRTPRAMPMSSQVGQRPVSASNHDAAAAGPYRRILTQGTFYSSSLQLANVSAVLPFICAQVGSVFVAGLLFPVFSIGIVAGNSASAFVLGWSRHLKHYVFAGAAIAIALLFTFAAIASDIPGEIDVVFLVTSAAMGVAIGISNGAHSELISAKLPETRRCQLILGQGAIGAVVVITATLLVLPLLTHYGIDSGRATVLWVGAVGMLAAAAAALHVGPVHSHLAFHPARMTEMFRRGYAVTRSQLWFRQYVIIQLLFVPVSLGATFYSLHAANQHSEPHRVELLVMFSSAGMLIGCFVWRAVYRAFGVRGMLIVSSLLAVTAALLCLHSHIIGLWQHPLVHGIVLLLAVMADQAIYAAAVTWIGRFAAEHERAMLMGFGAALIALVTSCLGVAFGAIAADVTAVWPVAIVLLLNFGALAAATRAPGRPQLAGAGG